MDFLSYRSQIRTLRVEVHIGFFVTQKGNQDSIHILGAHVSFLVTHGEDLELTYQKFK